MGSRHLSIRVLGRPGAAVGEGRGARVVRVKKVARAMPGRLSGRSLQRPHSALMRLGSHAEPLRADVVAEGSSAPVLSRVPIQIGGTFMPVGRYWAETELKARSD